MADPREVRLFISYKTDNADPKKSSGLSQAAHMVRRILEQRRFDVWMDVMRIKPGEEWPKAIFKGLNNCDIVLLLISAESKNSTGQQEEIRDARKLDKRILPIYIRGKFNAVEVMEQNFKLIEKQLVDFRIGDDNQVNKLLDGISTIATELNLAVPSMIAKRKSKDEIKPQQEKYSTYQLDGHSCNIHLAVGNVIEMQDIDVFVNTENAYLQMARIFESSTISALLRYEGSYIKNRRLVEDTIQEELNGLITQSRNTKDEITLPAEFGTVFVTSSGHPLSNLRKSDYPRYIFHTIAVDVRGSGTDKRMEPARDGDIKECTVNALEMVMTVNNQKGVVSPTGTGISNNNGQLVSERDRQIDIRDKGKYSDITSIILPLFASGHAGIPPSEVEAAVMHPICGGIKEFLEKDQRKKPNKTSLKDIHVCVYGYSLLPLMEKTMLSYFRLVNPPRKPVI